MAITVASMDLLLDQGFTLANVTGTIATVSLWIVQNIRPGWPQGYCVLGWNLRKHNPYFMNLSFMFQCGS